MNRHVVVVGASVAGVRVVSALRRLGMEGEVTLIGAEAMLPYDRPPLSKQYLAGKWDEARITLLTEEQAARQQVRLRLGSPATALDPVDKTVSLADGSKVGYDIVVVATGASARHPSWARVPGVRVLRTLDDSRRLRADLARPGPVVVVGGGFIGTEVAATARFAQHEVVVVDPVALPLRRAIGPDLAGAVVAHHQAQGVDLRLGVGVHEVTGGPDAHQVVLDDGTVLAASTVVVGVGAVPEIGWLEGSGITLDNGVVCDPWCRAVGTSDVFAAGDVATWYHLDYDAPVRVEHWTNAAEQAAAVASAIVDPDGAPPYRPVEYVWSDQYDWKVQIAGRPGHGPTWHIVGSLAAAEAGVAVVSYDGDRLTGVATVNWPAALAYARRALGAGDRADTVVDHLERTLAARRRVAADVP